ncbi:MAG: 2-amino-4-hydroxy-6-hydroxymethyldihydropteridine diphosphokinase [Planctomycetes bacterium]|nr:2-amino-4-hydroxy-6-hydroxymethyldihydropteridine diphosphokinase [Planctomycetota bacterium]
MLGVRLACCTRAAFDLEHCAVARVYVGIGSNLGDRRKTVERAIGLLRQRPDVTVRTVSSLVETAPVGGPPGQGRFLNGALELETDLEPEPLLDVLQEIERQLGRQRTVRWGPRTIDLDVLLWDDRVIESPRLHVPHARLRERRFVLGPLNEIAPGAIDPVTGLTVGELLSRLPAGDAEA